MKMKTWYNRIRDLRTDHDLTQAQIAKVLGTRQEYYSKYELGKRKLPIEHLKTLAQFYSVSSDYILCLTNDPTPPERNV